MNYLDYFDEMKQQLQNYETEFYCNVAHVQNEINKRLMAVQSWKLAHGSFFEIMPLHFELSGLSSGYPINKPFQSLEYSRKKNFNSFGLNQNYFPIIQIIPINLNYSNTVIIYNDLFDFLERISIHAVIESVNGNTLFFNPNGATFASSYSRLITLNDKEKLSLSINDVKQFFITHYYYSDDLIDKVYMEVYRYSDKNNAFKIIEKEKYDFHIKYEEGNIIIHEGERNFLVFKGKFIPKGE